MSCNNPDHFFIDTIPLSRVIHVLTPIDLPQGSILTLRHRMELLPRGTYGVRVTIHMGTESEFKRDVWLNRVLDGLKEFGFTLYAGPTPQSIDLVRFDVSPRSFYEAMKVLGVPPFRSSLEFRRVGEEGGLVASLEWIVPVWSEYEDGSDDDDFEEEGEMQGEDDVRNE